MRHARRVSDEIEANFAKSHVELAHSVDRSDYSICLPLPVKIDPTVAMMQVEEKPDVTYADVGGCVEQIERLREVVEKPLLDPESFARLGIEPPKGVLMYGPPGTGKTLLASSEELLSGTRNCRVVHRSTTSSSRR